MQHDHGGGGGVRGFMYRDRTKKNQFSVFMEIYILGYPDLRKVVFR